MSLKVHVPGLSLAARGYQYHGKIDVIVVTLDREGRAYDKASGDYLKLVEISENHVAIDLGGEEGQYVTLRDGHLAVW